MAIDIGPRIGIDGEREFRAAIQNITQQIKTMDSEMGAAAAAFAKSEDAEKKDAATKKILSDQIDAQRKKLDLLREGLEKSTAKYGENDTRTLKWRQSVAEATSTLYKMEGQLDDVGDELDETGKGMSDAEKETSKFGDTAKGVFTGQAILDGIKAMGRAISSLVSYGADAVTSTASLGDQIDKQSQRLGISRTEYQRLSYALDKYGVNVDGLQTGLKNMAVQAQKGSDAFTKLGLSQDYVRAASTEDLFEAVIGKLQGMAEGTERTAIANDILGRSATDLAPLLNDTAEGFEALKNEAPLMSDATVTASAAMQDSMSAFQSTITEIKSDVAGQVMPAITRALDTARRKLSTGEARKAIDKAGQALGKIAGQLVELAARALPVVAKLVTSVATNFGKWAIAIGGVVLAFKGFAIIKSLTTAVNAAKTAFAGLNAVMSANPYGAVLSAIGLLIGAISSFVLISDDASGSAGKLSERMQEIRDASEAADESYKNALDTFRDEDSVLDANIQKTKDLWDELQVLAGATGNVNEKDRERAEYILGELNDALGTEYEMTGNQITQYRDMRDSIYEVIEAKQANAKLELAKGLYDDALQNKQAKVDEMLAYAKGVETAQENLDNAIANHNENVRIATEKGDFGYAEKTAKAWKISLERYQNDLFNAEQAFAQSQAVVGAYENTIATYEDASYAIATGDYEKGIRLINSLTGARFDAYEETTRLSEKEKKLLKENISDQERIVQAYRTAESKKLEGFTKKTLDAEQQKLDRMKRLYENQNNVWIAKGIELAEGFANGIGQKSGSARRKVQEIVSGVIETVDAAGGNARRAGETVSSSFGDGISAYSNRAVENSAKMAAEVIRRMDCIDQANKMGQYIARGLADGMSSQQKYVVNKTDQLINELLFGIKDTAQIHSPSRVTAGFGRFIMRGIPAGMQDELPKALAAVRNMTGTIMSAMQMTAPSRVGSLAFSGAGGGAPSYTTNMGGITINMTVNAPNAANVGDLANMVSARIRDTLIDIQQSRR